MSKMFKIKIAKKNWAMRAAFNTLKKNLGIAQAQISPYSSLLCSTHDFDLV